MSQPDFTVDIDQDKPLPEGGQRVHAIVTVTTAGTPSAAPIADETSAEIIIIDCSGSMTAQSKFAEAQAATAAAVDAIRDGVDFTVIAGTDRVIPVYPSILGLVVAEPQTREWAKRAVADLEPGGMTAMGQWLRRAQKLFISHPAQLRHVIMLTDGKNEDETSDELDTAIKLCEGAFSCDCRGVGSDWDVADLRQISAALHGTVDAVPDPAGRTAEFSAMMLAAAGSQVADVALRIWTPQHASVEFVKQVAPTVQDLTGQRAQSGPQTSDYPVGVWGSGETRDYHLCVRVAPGTVGQEMLAARVSLVTASPTGPLELGEGPVRAIWADDEALWNGASQHVTHQRS
jgi:hypothetical protein